MPALQPGSEHGLQKRTLGIEAMRPLGVVWDDDDQFVGHA
jgi:hypothetical protein